MESGMWPLQVAIYSTLEGYQPLTDVANGIHDEVSEDAVKPYCTIGAFDSIPFETKDIEGESISVTLHSWSDYPGKKEAMQLNSLMLQAVTEAPLPIGSGFVLALQKRISSRVFTDIDGTTHHGVLELRFEIRKG